MKVRIRKRVIIAVISAAATIALAFNQDKAAAILDGLAKVIITTSTEKDTLQ